MTERYQAAIIGGGPTGLTAALKLSRARQRIVVFDSPEPPRNAASHGSHGIVGLDGIRPEEYRERGWADLNRYGMAELREVTVADVVAEPGGGFTVVGSDGGAVRAAQVLLAVGTTDVHPEVEGFAECWGKTVIHCPFCNGWENRDRAWGVVTGDPEFAAVIARAFGEWSPDVCLFANGVMPGAEEIRAQLKQYDRELIEGEIVRLHHDGGELHTVELADGTRVARGTLMWHPEHRPVPLVARLGETLGLSIGEKSFVPVDEGYRTNIPGLYAAGDITTDWQGVAEGAYAGSTAAFWMIFDS